MEIHIIFKNDVPLIAYEDEEEGMQQLRYRSSQSDGSIKQGSFTMRTISLKRRNVEDDMSEQEKQWERDDEEGRRFLFGYDKNEGG